MKHFLFTLRQNRGFILFLFLMFAFRSAIADWNDVPTGSMKPTIVEGDRILVNKLAYDLHLPFTSIRLMNFSDPERGDIVVFNSAVSEKRLVKRVMGLPGDRIAMKNNRVSINGEPLNYMPRSQQEQFVDAIEAFGNLEHLVRFQNASGAPSSFQEVTVPEAHYLVLGDNRDNSADSRMIGFVPRHEIIGRSKHVVLSLDYDNYFLPRSERFFKAI